MSDASALRKACAIIVVVVAATTGLCIHAGPTRTEGTMEEETKLPDFKFELGAKVRCKITGFEGVVTGQHRWLYGCMTYTVKPAELKDGKPIESQSFDEGGIERVEVKPLQHTPTTTGGPCPCVAAVSR